MRREDGKAFRIGDLYQNALAAILRKRRIHEDALQLRGGESFPEIRHLMANGLLLARFTRQLK
jgi:hypothetical protein